MPVSDKEIEKILGQIKDGVAQPKSGIEYSIGEKVQVVDGLCIIQWNGGRN